MVSTAFAIILIMGSNFVPTNYSFASEQSCREFGDRWAGGRDGWWSEGRSYQCIPLKVGEPFPQQPAGAK